MMDALNLLTKYVPWTTAVLLWALNEATCWTLDGRLVTSYRASSNTDVSEEYEPTSGFAQHPPNDNSTTTATKAAKTANPFLLVALVVSALLVLVLTFAYLIRKHEPQDDDPNINFQHQQSNVGFEPDSEANSSITPLPPSYDDVVKVPWTVWAATQQQGTGATPPPSYEDVHKMFPFPK
ncbi:hypothetical protein IscW_ISCW004531 [Ixodes scapularis]|uniref:Transmembrane protein n=1 Tax=Ixodes scapularis TaxID=6945 RepID=B7PH06_IXOSC|nr:hypothetical protein IscW_ISCW004531 [Ixodes scapularis]|eukprot:XP_002401769.1 hypothetical protein IscW_ISCW004531 [Ixodes scapularis]